MKYSLVALLILTLANAGCQQTTVSILARIDGRWQIESVNYTRPAKTDSLTNPTNSFLTFEQCSNRENKTDCDLYAAVNKSSYLLSFKIGDLPGRKKQVTIAPKGSDVSVAYRAVGLHLGGTYVIEQLTDRQLVIVCDDAQTNAFGVTGYKSRRITARRTN